MDIYVYIDACNLVEAPLLLGVLSANLIRGKEVFSFKANEEWLSYASMAYLDADLQPYQGNQFVSPGKSNFGLFLDSCPDRWGRVLMQRRERIRAKESNKSVRKLQESDYLLGVYDGNRMGALRFKTTPKGPFLDDDQALATPPFTSLRALEQASLGYERESAEDSPEYKQWVRMLSSPGSSLGGARPKANVIDEKGDLWIAKFPSHHDSIDAGAWEYLVTSMAHDFGLRVPQIDARLFSSRYHTFLTKRFDRVGINNRLYFASAMTLLGYVDGNDANDDISYLELAEFLQRYGGNAQQEDLTELWKRVLFNVSISNCDDHLRNHGFLLTPKGWELSPVYDLTPNSNGTGLKLNIDESDNALDIDLVLSTASYYGVSEEAAFTEVKRLKPIIASWRERAEHLSIPRSEQNMMATAFQALNGEICR